MRQLYSLLLYLLSPLLVLRLLWRSRKLPAYRHRIGERFGFFPQGKMSKTIWIHAVSVGEFLAVKPFIDALMLKHPKHAFVVTTTTPTGSEQVSQQLGGQVFHVYMPYDLPCAVRRFLNKIDPVVAIFMETEIWPNMLSVCHARNVKTVLINGRLSEKSLKSYQSYARVIKPAVALFDVVIAQYEADAQRFLLLGVPKDKLVVLGNLKVDGKLPPDAATKGVLLRDALGSDRAIFMAASTHEGEEAIVLDAFKAIKSAVPRALLLLVPRHPDRFDQVYESIKSHGFTVVRRSTAAPVSDEIDVFLGDTMGEMMTFYIACDVSLVAGSFMPIGGHNLFEPALVGKPVLSGPHLFNFETVSQLLLEGDALTIVEDEASLIDAVVTLLQNPILRQSKGQKAKDVVSAHTGALVRQVDRVSYVISDC